MATRQQLLRCSSCGRHVFADERACPFCRAARAVRTAGIAAALVASACGGNATQTTVADSGSLDRVVDARSDAPSDANAAHDADMMDAAVIVLDAGPDAAAPDAGPDAAAPDADPCFGKLCTPNCPCPIYRSPPPRQLT